MKNKHFWISLAGVVLTSAAILMLNFRLTVSSIWAEKLLITTDMGDELPASMRQNNKISIVVIGEGLLASALQKVLNEKISEAGLGEIEPGHDPESLYHNPVLVIKVGSPNIIWTPFFAMSSIPVHAGYTSDGDAAFIETVEETHTSVSKKDVAFMYAEYNVNECSLGLISHLGYHQYLADYLAHEIVTALEGLYNG